MLKRIFLLLILAAVHPAVHAQIIPGGATYNTIASDRYFRFSYDNDFFY